MEAKQSYKQKYKPINVTVVLEFKGWIGAYRDV